MTCTLVSCAGLAPVLQLAERAGLQRLVGEHAHLTEPGGVNAHLKGSSLVAGMGCRGRSHRGLGLLRHGARKRLFAGVRAPSTLGTFLRTFTFGHVRQLDAVASRLLINLGGQASLLPGAEELGYVDVDDTLKQTYGYAKQSAGRGYTGVKGLNALLAIVSTPSSAPLIACARLRKGGANSVRGAGRFVTDALITSRGAGGTGVLVLRAGSAYYGHDVIAAALRQGACFSITPGKTKPFVQPSPPSPATPGRRSGPPTRSSMKPSSAGSPTLTSPRSTTPRSRRGPRPSTSAPG